MILHDFLIAIMCCAHHNRPYLGRCDQRRIGHLYASLM